MRFGRLLPGPAEVGGQRSGEPELGISGDGVGVQERGGALTGGQPQLAGADGVGVDALGEGLRKPARAADRPLQPAVAHGGLAVERRVPDDVAARHVAGIVDAAARGQDDAPHSVAHRAVEERADEAAAVGLYEVERAYAVECAVPGAGVGPVEGVLAGAGRRARRYPGGAQSGHHAAAGLAGGPGDEDRSCVVGEAGEVFVAGCVFMIRANQRGLRASTIRPMSRRLHSGRWMPYPSCWPTYGVAARCSGRRS